MPLSRPLERAIARITLCDSSGWGYQQNWPRRCPVDVSLSNQMSMEKTFRLLLLGFLGLLLAIVAARVVDGKPEYTRKENTPCATCHTKAGAKELNDVGKCYAEKHSLKDCQVPKEKPKQPL
jgi:hypothetical protein